MEGGTVKFNFKVRLINDTCLEAPTQEQTQKNTFSKAEGIQGFFFK